MTALTPRRLFRTAAVAEAITWALLLVGMVVKYAGPTDALVRVFGMLHGIVFVAYVLVTVFVWVNQRWRPATGVLALLSSVPPLVTILFDVLAERRRRLDGGWRLLHEQPSGPLEHGQALLLRRPLAAVGVLVVAVAVLTALALVVGPPGASA
ncbi:hypothetical protein GCM10011519_00120 [Marmoricola endophyticus]|uniref:DUF3817 domain-containing protein n=1 Tax=Marmoricola endophyticus TaxID=2040280 RepID=A0A917B7Y1_9ACTN|nr:DUF3817 domain-containing protein [Marmoricola endophyticus]GGF30679.1 hypothetical protein GCM10011519_00120 [Marmoricola endophyticus]